MTDTRSGRRSIALVVGSIALVIGFECLLILIAFAGYGTQGNAGQDQPIAFSAILEWILVMGNAVGLFIALLIYAVTLHRKRHSVTVN